MREILFRGKHINLFPQNEHLNGTWVYGYLCDKNYINFPGLNGELLVDPSTIGQYTGLVDKNGRRIFEGDIVKSIETKETGVVQFFPEHSAFMVWCKSSNEVGFLYECTSIAEVIGNIHDNPELLEED